MEVEGLVLAVAIVALLVYAVPHMLHNRTLASQARTEERFAHDLRIVETHETLTAGSAAHHDKQHCTIYTRPPEVSMPAHEQRATRSHTLRSYARERANVRGNIAGRRALLQRVYLGTGVVTAVALIGWIAGFATSLPLWVPGVLTALTCAAGAASLGLTREAQRANMRDEERIAALTKKINRARRPFASQEGRVEVGDRAQKESADGHSAYVREEGKVVSFSNEKEQHEKQRSEEVQQRSDKAAQRSVEASQKHTDLQHTQRTHEFSTGHEVSDHLNERTAQPSLPSYTLKPRESEPISRKVVARALPVQESEESVSVPYRPTQLGEHIDGTPSSGNDSASSHKIFGGSSLENVLQKRRA